MVDHGDDELDVKALSLGDGFHQIDVKPTISLFGASYSKDDRSRPCRPYGYSLNSGGGEQSSKCGGSENFGLKGHEQTPSVGTVCRRFCGRIFDFRKRILLIMTRCKTAFESASVSCVVDAA
ncbi:MAG: hypothetical protein ACLTZW_03860 [Paratractidigestivibacter faecalis]